MHLNVKRFFPNYCSRKRFYVDLLSETLYYPCQLFLSFFFKRVKNCSSQLKHQTSAFKFPMPSNRYSKQLARARCCCASPKIFANMSKHARSLPLPSSLSARGPKINKGEPSDRMSKQQQQRWRRLCFSCAHALIRETTKCRYTAPRSFAAPRLVDSPLSAPLPGYKSF